MFDNRPLFLWITLEWTGAWSVIDRISGLQQPEDGICGLQQGSGCLCTVCDGKILRIIARIPQTQTKLKQNYAIIRKKVGKGGWRCASCTSGLGTEARELGKIITRPTAGPCTLRGGRRFLHAAGAGENYLRRAVAFGVCLHERLLYPGYDGSKVLRPGRNCAV